MEKNKNLTRAFFLGSAIFTLCGFFNLQAQELSPSQAANNLGTRLYAMHEADSGNIFLSPFSVLSAVGLAQEGAAGPTADQMRKALRLNSNSKTRLEDFKNWIGVINSPTKSFELHTSNNLWVQKNVSLSPTYLKTAQTNFGGGVTNLDFTNDPNGSAQTINDKVSKETAGFIPQLVSPASISDATRLILTNAIYFKSDWDNPFKKESTDKEDFHLANEKTEPVSMMNQDLTAPMGDFEGSAQVLALPYRGGEVSMYIFLPPLGKMAKLEKALTGDNLNSFLEPHPVAAKKNDSENFDTGSSAPPTTDVTGLPSQEVMLTLPKFTFRTSYDLTASLNQMGMPLAFTKPASETGSGADFSGIDGKKDLFITGVFHQAYVAVDETGTTAAAATAIEFGVEGAEEKPTPPPFLVDHPFIFMIVENTTHTVLFMGRVNDPLAKN